jgi:trimethylamine--corrinoid protein Co-methyltransferase
MNDATPARRRRAGGRKGHADRAGHAAIEQTPWRIPVNTDPPIEPLSPDGVQDLHNAALRILSEIGIEFLNEDAVGHLKRAGCIVEGQTVRFDPDFVTEMMARAPAEYTITPRNPDRRNPHGGQAYPVRQCLVAAQCLGP